MLLRRPALPAELGIFTVRGGAAMRHVMNLLAATLDSGLTAFGVFGLLYLVNGTLGEQLQIRLPCTVTNVTGQSTRRSTIDGKIYCRADDGTELGLTLWSEAEAGAARERLSPGTRIEAMVYEGSLGLWYTSGSPLAAMPAAAD